ncbi:MAG: class I SAM-dependent methyltransferase [Acidimicrobiia bacterium]|nr:class I SAM-dependent methyltransferase [Acidimicrobiia bacterium]
MTRFIPSNLANRFQRWNRARKFEQFLQLCPDDRASVLDVGFTVTEHRGIENTLERSIDDVSRVTALTIADPNPAGDRYPGLTLVRYDGGRFPFSDREFNACWSNAVLEHVGDEADRRRFLAEADRVAEQSLLTTPNRWFPIEPHTMLPFLHYLPKPVFDWMLRRIGKDWATGSYMHLMGRREVVRLLREAGVKDFRVRSNRVGPLTVDFSILIRPGAAGRPGLQRQREAESAV